MGFTLGELNKAILGLAKVGLNQNDIELYREWKKRGFLTSKEIVHKGEINKDVVVTYSFRLTIEGLQHVKKIDPNPPETPYLNRPEIFIKKSIGKLPDSLNWDNT